MEEDAVKGKTCLIKEDNEMVTIPRSKTFTASAKLLEGPSFCMPQEIRRPVAGTSQQEEVQITLGERESDLANEINYTRDDKELRELRTRYAPLLRAALKGDWQAGEVFLKENPRCIALPITREKGTALHNAAAARRTTFVKELVKLMSPSDLEFQTEQGATALIFAVQSGSVTIAREMVEKNKKLPCISAELAGNKMTPLGFAAWYGPRHKKMVSYLLSVTPNEHLTAPERTRLLRGTIYSDMFDIAWKILKMDPELLLAESETPIVWEALKMLASKPLAIGSKSRLSIWERCLNACFNWFCNKALMRTLAHRLVENLWKSAILADEQFSNKAMADNLMALLAEAAKVGNVEFLVILIRSSPDLIWQTDKRYGSLFHIAIKYRQEKVFSLIYEIGSLKDSVASICDGKKNNMLHLAGELAPRERLDIVPGAALQMQRELLWFKEVEKIIRPLYATTKNKKGKLPKDLFRQNHRALRAEGEKWMKDTANSCMLVAALIATVVFAAAFTVPGGSKQETGTPIFLGNNWFTVYFVSVAIALLASSTTILIFLSVLTSRYTEDDFLKRLPRRLVFGLSTLFISIVSMEIGFSATCFLVYNSESASVPIIILAAAGIPIFLFIVLHRDLWVDIIRSTFISRSLFCNKHRLF